VDPDGLKGQLVADFFRMVDGFVLSTNGRDDALRALKLMCALEPEDLDAVALEALPFSGVFLRPVAL
jgi:hypothetical protein